MSKKKKGGKKSRLTSLTSEYKTGGLVSWQTLQISGSSFGGEVYVSPKNVDWNRLILSLNWSTESEEVQGWAVADFHVDEKGRFMVYCESAVQCFVDDTKRILTGDMFRSGKMKNSIDLEQGPHRIYIPLKFKAQTKFRCVVSRVKGASNPQNIQVFQPLFQPDLLAISKGIRHPESPISRYFLASSSFVSLPVLNLDGKWHQVEVRASSSSLEGKSIQMLAEPTSRFAARVAPGQLSAIPLRLRIISTAGGKKKSEKLNLEGINSSLCPLSFKLVVGLQDNSKTEWNSEVSISLRCRTTRQSFIFTFLDHDATVQRAAAIAPLLPGGAEACEGSGCERSLGVVLSQHGTGVDVSMQADSYKFKPKKHAKNDRFPYIFGVKHAWVLAPTRFGAHNWEYTGFRSALAALEALGDAIPVALRPLLPRVDTSRVVFAGHSMGGHGAWHIASHVPDRALAVASAAGWIKKEHYGDSNRFFVHDVGGSYVDPKLKYVLEATFAEHNADFFAGNLRGIPVLARVGSEDKAVPPWEVRRIVRVLRSHGVNVSFSELKGKEHWWWDTKHGNDGGVLNDRAMRNFFAESFGADGNRHRNVSGDESSFSTLVVVNPASSGSKMGVRVLQQHVPFQNSKVKFEFFRGEKGDTSNTRRVEVVSLTTRNVRRMRVDSRYLCTEINNNYQNQETPRNKLYQNQDPTPTSSSSCGFIVDGSDVFWLNPGKIAHLCQYERTRKKQADSQKQRLKSKSAGGEGETETCSLNNDNQNQWNPGINDNAGSSEGLWNVCEYEEESSASELLDDALAFGFQRIERGPGNSGPARQVHAAGFAVVAGAGSPLSLASALFIANTHYTTTGTSVALLSDTDVLGEYSSSLGFSPSSHNLILVGNPSQNLLTKKLMADIETTRVGPPVSFNFSAAQQQPCRSSESEISGSREERKTEHEALSGTSSSSSDVRIQLHVGPCRFKEAGTGIVFVAPHWDGEQGAARLRLVVAGVDDEGLRNAMRLAVPTIPPMMRAPFSNQIPDFVVVGSDVAARGAGGILAAGFWGSGWEFVSETSYYDC